MVKGIDDTKIIPKYPTEEELQREATEERRKERQEKLEELGKKFKDFVKKSKRGR